jgi:hypothetical protein
MGRLGTGMAQRFNGLDGWKRTCMRRMYMYSCAVENAGEHVRSPTAAVQSPVENIIAAAAADWARHRISPHPIWSVKSPRTPGHVAIQRLTEDKSELSLPVRGVRHLLSNLCTLARAATVTHPSKVSSGNKNRCPACDA